MALNEPDDPTAKYGDLKAEITDISRQRAPNEACGFIIKAGKEARVIETPNTSATPKQTFRIAPEDFERAEDAGKIAVVWHSHYNQRPDPSMGDKVMSERCKLPFLIVSVPNGEFAYYEPNGYEAPLLERPFVHGVLDCFSAFRDYYKRVLNIDLPEFEREDDWWKKGGNLYLKNYKKGNFKLFNKDDVPIQKHDGLLMAIRSEVVNHIAVYLGDGVIYHHLQGRLSEEVPYVIDRGYYPKQTRHVVRHASLCSSTSDSMDGSEKSTGDGGGST